MILFIFLLPYQCFKFNGLHTNHFVSLDVADLLDFSVLNPEFW